jgi:hypothetical protein
MSNRIHVNTRRLYRIAGSAVSAAASAGIALALALGAGTAHADPVGATSNDQHNAQIICNELAANPTPQGLRLSMNDTYAQLIQKGSSDADARDDAVDGTLYALLYTCPQYQYLVPR